MSKIDELIRELCPDGVNFLELGKVIRLNFGTRITKMNDMGTLFPVYGGGGESFRTDEFNRQDEYVISRFAMSERCVRKVTGKFWLLDSGFTFSVSSEEVAYDYVAFWLLSSQKAIFNATSQGAQKNLKVEEFKRFRIPVPPIQVQNEIISILNSFTQLEAELEAELEARRKQYHFYRNYISQGITHYKPRNLHEIADFFNAKAHEQLVDPNGDIALMTARFISRGEANRFVKSQDVLTPAFTGDVALVMSDLPNGKALAKTFYVDRDNAYAANQRVCLLRTKDPENLNPKFLAYVLNRNKQLLKYDTGVDQTHLKKNYILDLQIPLPPIGEQKRIVDILDQFDELVDGVNNGLPAELSARRKQYEYYRDKLLTFKELAA